MIFLKSSEKFLLTFSLFTDLAVTQQEFVLKANSLADVQRKSKKNSRIYNQKMLERLVFFFMKKNENAVILIENTDREVTAKFMKLKEYVDVILGEQLVMILFQTKLIKNKEKVCIYRFFVIQ